MPLLPPSPEASRINMMVELWTEAGLEAVETRVITVERTFADLDDYWTTIQGGQSVGAKLAGMPRDDFEKLKSRMRDLLPTDPSGRITYRARTNVVKGRVPK